PGADFVTSPTLSPLFGATLAPAVDACHRALGRPMPFTLCEVGCGSGRLMADLLGAAADAGAAWLQQAEVVLIERRPAPAGGVPDTVRWSRSLVEVEPFTGVVLGNEVLDNLPVRLRSARGEEIRVGAGTGGLEFVPDADPVVVDPVGARGLIADVAATLTRGFVLLIDYGSRGVAGPRAFQAHGIGDDV